METNANFMQVGKVTHCLYCHKDIEGEFREHAIAHTGTPTACTPECGKWYKDEDIDELVRDICSVVPKSKSEVRGRLNSFYSRLLHRDRERVQKEMYKALEEVAQYEGNLVNKEDIKVWIFALLDQ